MKKCKFCHRPILKSFATGIGDYWFHFRTDATFCNQKNPNWDRVATPEDVTEDE